MARVSGPSRHGSAPEADTRATASEGRFLSVCARVGSLLRRIGQVAPSHTGGSRSPGHGTAIGSVRPPQDQAAALPAGQVPPPGPGDGETGRPPCPSHDPWQPPGRKTYPPWLCRARDWAASEERSSSRRMPRSARAGQGPAAARARSRWSVWHSRRGAGAPSSLSPMVHCRSGPAGVAIARPSVRARVATGRATARAGRRLRARPLSNGAPWSRHRSEAPGAADVCIGAPEDAGDRRMMPTARGSTSPRAALHGPTVRRETADPPRPVTTRDRCHAPVGCLPDTACPATAGRGSSTWSRGAPPVCWAGPGQPVRLAPRHRPGDRGGQESLHGRQGAAGDQRSGSSPTRRRSGTRSSGTSGGRRSTRASREAFGRSSEPRAGIRRRTPIPPPGPLRTTPPQSPNRHRGAWTGSTSDTGASPAPSPTLSGKQRPTRGMRFAQRVIISTALENDRSLRVGCIRSDG